MTIVILPGHGEAWRIDEPASEQRPRDGWAPKTEIAAAAKQMAELGATPREAFRMASFAGFNQGECAWIAKMVKTGSWREFFEERNTVGMVKIFCDGLCEPRNPGGWGCWAMVATEGEKRLVAKHGNLGRESSMTNNIAEYRAVIEALDWATATGQKDVEILSDSQLVIRQITGQYGCNSDTLKPLLAEVRNRVVGIASLRFSWVPREQNTVADHLTRLAYEKQSKFVADVNFN